MAMRWKAGLLRLECAHGHWRNALVKTQVLIQQVQVGPEILLFLQALWRCHVANSQGIPGKTRVWEEKLQAKNMTVWV